MKNKAKVFSTPNITRIGKVSVNLDTPPSYDQLEMLMTEAGHSKQEQKQLINDSKLYAAVSTEVKSGSKSEQSNKDS